jgi:GAF domain-containing protein
MVTSASSAGEHMADRYAEVEAFIRREPVSDEDGHGVVAGMRRLCGAAGRALAASGAGLTVMADGGLRGVSAASDPATEGLEELQLTLGEGPCIDAYRLQRPVLIPDLADGAMTRWPAYAPAVHAHGVRAVFAFPLQIGAARLGVMDVFRTEAGMLGLLLADQQGRLEFMAAWQESVKVLELFQVQNQEGPCPEAFRAGTPVINADLEHATDRWPRFTPRAVEAGFRPAHAFPLRLRAERIGAMNVFSANIGGRLADTDVEIVQALADVASIGLLQERAISRGELLTEQLQGRAQQPHHHRTSQRRNRPSPRRHRR